MEQTQTCCKRAVFPVVLAVLQVVAVLIMIAVNFIKGGYQAGCFDLDDILFKGISSLANRSDYEIAISAGRRIAFLALLILGGLLLVLFLKSKGRSSLQSPIRFRVAAQILSNAMFLFFAFLIVVYEFSGFTRIVLYPAVLVCAVIYVIITAKYSVRAGATAVILQVLAFLAAFYIVWLVCPIFGALLAVLGDIFSFFLVLLLLTGGTSRFVRVIRL